MFIEDDTTYYELREKSVLKWLEDLSVHRDVEVRGGVDITLEYIEALRKKIMWLEEKNQLKDKYLKDMKERLSKY